MTGMIPGVETSPARVPGRRTRRGFRPESDAEDLRELLAESLSEVGAASRGVEAMPTDGATPPDEPPGLGPPPPRRSPAYVHLGAKLIARLRRDYGRGVPSDDGRIVGDLPEVAEWLAGLKPGRVRPSGIVG